MDAGLEGAVVWTAQLLAAGVQLHAQSCTDACGESYMQNSLPRDQADVLQMYSAYYSDLEWCDIKNKTCLLGIRTGKVAQPPYVCFQLMKLHQTTPQPVCDLV